MLSIEVTNRFLLHYIIFILITQIIALTLQDVISHYYKTVMLALIIQSNLVIYLKRNNRLSSTVD